VLLHFYAERSAFALETTIHKPVGRFGRTPAAASSSSRPETGARPFSKPAQEKGMVPNDSQCSPVGLTCGVVAGRKVRVFALSGNLKLSHCRVIIRPAAGF